MNLDTLNGSIEAIAATFAAITAGVGLFMALRPLWKYLGKKKAIKNEETFRQVNFKITDLISELRMKTKASRVSLTQFHNGGKFADGSSMRRMSISHQSCDPKIGSTMQFRQDVLVSRFVEIIQQLRENNSYIRNTESLFESNTKKFHELHDIFAYSTLPLFCSDSLVVYGYITIEWCDLETLDNVDEKDVKGHIDYARDQISFLLNSAKDYR
jgi:hypothetical protein